jgi:predicted unusual protein kinase regulating ubiquinone biosynthesis (AarF/ABC1/UbiB family)
LAVKIFWKVYWFQKRHRNRRDPAVQEKWDRLMQELAQEFKQKVVSLGGLLIKIGQFLSIRSDLLPSSFVGELSGLVDQVPPSPWEKARDVLEAEWGRPVHEVLKEVGSAPVAAASIGEVYKATLHDGQTVAVKVQRHNIQDIITADLHAIKIVTWMAEKFSRQADKVNFPMLYNEMQTVLLRELDFRTEMESGLYFAERYEQTASVRIPAFYPEFTTKKVLVLEWVNAHKITDLPFLDDIGVNREELAVEILRTFAPQWFGEGKFHADPHPGNVLIDHEGRIVLIDFGMIGELSKNDAVYLVQLVESIVFGNLQKTVESLDRLGFLLPNANKRELERFLKNGMSINFANLSQEELLELMGRIESTVKELPIQIPSRFIFFMRAVATVVGIVNILHPNADLMELGKPVFEELMQKEGKGKLKWAQEWLQGRPLVKALRSIPALLEEPRLYREWKQEEQHNAFVQQMHQSRKMYAFLSCLVTLLLTFASYLWGDEKVLVASAVLLGVSCIAYWMAARKQREWIAKRFI